MERKYTVDGREHTVETSTRKLESSLRGEGFLALTIDGNEHTVEVLELGAHSADLLVDGKRVVVHSASANRAGTETWVSSGGRARLVAEVGRSGRGSAGSAGGRGRLVTPQFPATVVKVLVEVGDSVARSQPLVTVSAMKMEMTLTAPYDGVITSINAVEGANVSPGDSLIDIEEEAAPDEGDDGRNE